MSAIANSNLIELAPSCIDSNMMYDSLAMQKLLYAFASHVGLFLFGASETGFELTMDKTPQFCPGAPTTRLARHTCIRLPLRIRIPGIGLIVLKPGDRRKHRQSDRRELAQPSD